MHIDSAALNSPSDDAGLPASDPSPDTNITSQASPQKHGGLNFGDDTKTLSHTESLLQDSQQLNGKSLVSESTLKIHGEALEPRASSSLGLHLSKQPTPK
jgi:hypothetical protein